MAARLHPSDRQRLLRALEVLAATGRSLASWQAAPPARLTLPVPVAGILLMPTRAALHARIEQRLGAMVAAGALDEVRAVLDLGLDPELPVMKALALRDLAAHLAGRASLDQALATAALATRRYAKRQQTWFRHHLPELHRIEGFGDHPDTTGAAMRLASGASC
jgi:tRNA dimethylallyltransferase